MGYWKTTFMAMCKLGFAMNKFVRKLELPNDFQWKFPMSSFNHIYEAVYGMHEELQLWSYVD